MRINNYETLIQVVKTGSITETAKRLFISQPAVTKQIKAIETHYGTVVFKREKNKIILTEDGKKVYDLAEKIVAYDSTLRVMLNKKADKIAGELHIIGSTIPSFYYIPKIASRFLKEYPEVRPLIETHASGEVLRRVKNGSVPFGFTGAKENDSNLEYIKVFEEEMVLVGNSNFHRKNVSNDFLSRQKFSIREEGSASRESFIRYLQSYGVELNDKNTMFVCKDNEMIKQTIKENDILAYMPRSNVDTYLKTGEITKLGKHETREFFYVYNVETELTKKQKAFHEFLLKEVRRDQ